MRKTKDNQKESIYELLDLLTFNMYGIFEMKFQTLVGRPIVPRGVCGKEHEMSEFYNFDECQVTPKQLQEILSWMPALVKRSHAERQRKLAENEGYCYVSVTSF